MYPLTASKRPNPKRGLRLSLLACSALTAGVWAGTARADIPEADRHQVQASAATIDKDGNGTIVLAPDGEATILAGTTFIASTGNYVPAGLIVDGTLDVSSLPNELDTPTLSGSGMLILGGTSGAFFVNGNDTVGLVLTQGTLTTSPTLFSGVISSAPSSPITYLGIGNDAWLRLSGANTFTGIVADMSRLDLVGDGSLADAAAIYGNGVFDISGTNNGASIKALSLYGQLILGDKTLTITDAVVSSAGTGGTPNFAGVISGSGGVSLTGGVETFYAPFYPSSVGGYANTYTGQTYVGAGATLALVYGASIADSSRVTIDGTLDLTGNEQANTYAPPPDGTPVGTFLTTLAGSGQVALGATTLTLSNASDTFSGVISGDGGDLVVAGGTETLTGDNTFTGGTRIITGATLKIGAGGTTGSILGDVSDGGTLVFDRSDALLFGGAVTGAGKLEQAAGGLVLTGANTYEGGTLIDAGATLQLGNGGTAGSIAGDVTDNGELVFDRSDAVTFDGAISGAGGLLQTGGGTLTLTGTNTFTGLTVIDRGSTLKLTGTGSIAKSGDPLVNGTFDISGTASGASVVSLSGSGSVLLGSKTLTLTGASDLFSGVIADGGAFGGTGGSLTISGGLEVLTGANTYTGLTTVDAGATLYLGNNTATGSIAGNVLDDGSLVFDRSNAYVFAGVISGAGLVWTNGGGAPVLTLTADNTYTGGTNIGNGNTLQLGAGGATGSIVGDVYIYGGGQLVFDRSNTVVFGGSISGPGNLTQAGTGLVVLNGVSPMSGLTTVTSGILEIGDAAHPGAVLDSRLGGVTVGAAGTLEGHGRIVGAVTNTAGGVVMPGGSIGTLTVGAYTQGATSKLDIEVSPTQASLLNSLGSASLAGTLNLTLDPGTYGARLYEIVAGAPVSGTFSTVNTSGAQAGLISGLYYKPDHTQVDLVIEPKAGAQGFAAVSTASLDLARDLSGAVENRIGKAGCAPGAAPDRLLGCEGVGVWAQALASSSRSSGDATALGSHGTSSGMLAGVDRRLDGAAVGFAFGFQENRLSLNASTAAARGPSYFASLYGQADVARTVFDAQGFWLRSDWSLTRPVGGLGTANSKPRGDAKGVVLQASWPLRGGDVTPYLRGSWAAFDRAAVSETGVAPLGFSAASARTQQTLGEVGVKLAHTFKAGPDGDVRPELRLGVEQSFGSNSRGVAASLTDIAGSGFETDAMRPARTSGVVAAAVRARLSERFELVGEARGRFSSNQSQGAVTLGGVYRF